MNQYLIICYQKKDGYILSTSQPLTIDQLKMHYNQYCLDLLFSLKENPDIDSIGFSFRRINKMRVNEQPEIKFNKSVSAKFKNGLRLIEEEVKLINRYSENQIIDLERTFIKILSFCNHHLFIEKIQPDIRIQFINDKIFSLFNELSFLNKLDFDDLWSMIISTLIYVMSYCEREEYYEVESNLFRYVKMNFDGDVVKEKNTFLSIM